jgi:hypothetical protein
MLWAPLVAVALSANPDLDKAAKLVADLQYAEAQNALEAALRRPGNDRETMVRIYELQGVVFGTLNQAAKATKAFALLLTLDPDHKLTGDNPPRVMTPFYEARGRASEQGKLDAKPLPAAVEAGRVAQVAIEVTSDPLKMVKKVRFHLKTEDKPWAEQSADLAGKTASVSTDGAQVSWWAELIGERDAVLLGVGTHGAPQHEGSAPVAKPDIKLAPKGEPLASPPAPPSQELTQQQPPLEAGTSSGRAASIALIAAGAVSLGVGVALGVVSFVDRNKVNNAMKDANGVVTGITQADAFALDATVHTTATVANVLFGVGGALAAAGVIIFIISPSSSSSVALAPSAQGFVLSGSW